MASDVIELTRALVRVDTTNPPGSEAAAIALLGKRLERAGLTVTSHELAPGRPSLVARWPGRSDVPRLVLSGTWTQFGSVAANGLATRSVPRSSTTGSTGAERAT